MSYDQPPPYDVDLEPSPATNPWEIRNTEGEAALLGGMMVGNNLIPAVMERVSEDDFFDPLHGRIFRAIVRLHERGKHPNPVLLRPIFENDEDMKSFGGVAYLAELTGSPAAMIGVVDFAEQIAELAVRRKVAMALKEALKNLSDGDVDSAEDVDDLVNQVQETAAAAMQRTAPLKPRSAESMVRRVRERVYHIGEDSEVVGASCRSVPDLDKVIGLLQPGYHIFGARPGMCKTTLAMTAAWGWAADGLPGEYYHSEMTEDQIAMRQASDLSHAMKLALRHDAIVKGALSGAQLGDLETIADAAAALPLTFVRTGHCDIRRVESAAGRAARRWKSKGRKLGFIVLDYIQKYSATDARGRKITDETEKVNAVSETCVRMAERLDIAVIALSQLTRGVDDRKDKRPQLNDLRQSGNLEQDADTVTLLYREEVHLKKEKPKKPDTDPAVEAWNKDMEIVRGKLELIGAKNRHGADRTRTVKFLHPYFAIRGGDFDEFNGGALLGNDLFDDRGERPDFMEGGR